MNDSTPIFRIGGLRFFSRIFVVIGEDKDLVAALYRDPGEPWQLTWRFRYYAGPEISDGNDVKRVYSASPPPEASKAEILRFVRGMLSMVLDCGFGGDGKIHEIVCETNHVRTILRILRREPFFHMKARDDQGNAIDPSKL